MKRKLKKILAGILLYSGLLDILIYFLKKMRKQKNAIILIYHRIVDDEGIYLAKKQTVHRHVDAFRKDMAYLSQRYKFISMNALVQQLDHGEAFKEPSIVVTFDDGYADNYTLAFPILQQLGIPATIFVVTDLIGTDQAVWTEEISYALLRSRLKKICLPLALGGKEVPVESYKDKQNATIHIAEALKKLPNPERIRCVEEILDNIDGHPGSSLSRMKIMLDWPEIFQMSEDNIDFGAHTHTHPILSKMLKEEGEREIRLSKEIIEEKIRRPVYYFAYPNGRSQDFTEELRKSCAEMGFKGILSAEYGNVKRGDNPFFLRRVGIDEDFACWVFDIARLLLFR